MAHSIKCDAPQRVTSIADMALLDNGLCSSLAKTKGAIRSLHSMPFMRSNSMMIVYALMAWIVLSVITLPAYAAENSQTNTADSTPISITTQPDNIVDYAEDRIN